MRVFAALELPAPVRGQLAGLIAGLRDRVPPGSVRWVRPEGIHLTLQFYGEIDRGRLPGLEAALGAAAATAGPLTLALEGLGAFPDLTRARVLWVGLSGEREALQQLQRAVEARSEPLGFKPEARGFNPHLTLGRVNLPLRPPDRRRLADIIARTPVPAGPPFTLAALSLMKSELGPGGAVYVSLAEYRLGAFGLLG